MVFLEYMYRRVLGFVGYSYDMSLLSVVAAHGEMDKKLLLAASGKKPPIYTSHHHGLQHSLALVIIAASIPISIIHCSRRVSSLIDRIINRTGQQSQLSSLRTHSSPQVPIESPHIGCSTLFSFAQALLTSFHTALCAIAVDSLPPLQLFGELFPPSSSRNHRSLVCQSLLSRV